MFRKTNKNEEINVPQPKKLVPSIVSQDMNVMGNIISEGIVDFDGKIDGNIRCRVLHVRQNAIINGEATAEEMFIHGRVLGTISAKSVTLHATAHVDGIVMHETIAIEDGATIDGKLKKTNKPVETYQTAPDYEAVEPISPAKLMENIRLIASNE